MLQFLVFESVRLVGGDAQPALALLFVRLEVAFAPVDVAVAFERQNVGRQTV
jgi:hypothetical protein